MQPSQLTRIRGLVALASSIFNGSATLAFMVQKYALNKYEWDEN